MRLPVSVGTGMRVLASSSRIASADTPTSLRAAVELAPDRRLLSGHALDGEEAHEAVGGGLGIDGHEAVLGFANCARSIVRETLRRKPRRCMPTLTSRRSFSPYPRRASAPGRAAFAPLP